MARAAFDADDMATWPLNLTTEEVAAIMRRTPKSIHNALASGSFLPLPFTTTRPLLWKREDIEAWRNGEFRDAAIRLRRSA